VAPRARLPIKLALPAILESLRADGETSARASEIAERTDGMSPNGVALILKSRGHVRRVAGRTTRWDLTPRAG
jgi:hypothetical protein